MFEEGFALLDKLFGNSKDNLIALATVAREKSGAGEPRPVTRTVDACYEDGAFYVVTDARSNKARQIAENAEISVCAFQEMFTASGVGENLGWVLAPQNAEIRKKLRTAFAEWYDMANNESDENTCILCIRLTKGTLNINHWETLYYMDFVNRTDMPDGGVY